MTRLRNVHTPVHRGERSNKLTDGRSLPPVPRDVSETYGPPELCSWQVEPSVFRIQTTEPRFSRKLEKREDTRRVEMTGVNHFRRTFELRGNWRKIRRIINRYVSVEVPAGDQFSGDFTPQVESKRRGSIRTAGVTQ